MPHSFKLHSPRPFVVALAAIIAVLATALGAAVTQNPAHAMAMCLPDMAYVKTTAQLNSRIFFQSNCGSTVTQLTNETDTARDTTPRVSPDGTSVLFLRRWTVDGIASTDLFVVPTSGGSEYNLTNTPTITENSGDWSPDSQKVVYNAYPGPTGGQIFMINQDGTGKAQITSGPDANDLTPCWALDGRIAFSRYQLLPTGFVTNLFVANPDGSGVHAVTNTPTEKRDCAWSPDGNYLFYDQISVNGGGSAAVADVATGQTALLGNTIASPTISNDWTLAVTTTTGIGFYNFATATIAPVLWDGESQPALVRSASVTAPPPGFPPAELGGDPTPTPTPTPTPAPDPLAVQSVGIEASPADRILTRTIKMVPSDPSRVARYEYGWSSTPDGTTKGATLQRCAIDVAVCRLNYSPTNPDTDWNLLVRVVATDGKKGPLFIKRIHTPKSPILVVFGDSLSSGHHRDSEGAPTICQDETYSYGQTVWNGMESQIPAQWQLAHGYLNVANSGFSTANVMFGGIDACGNSHPAELPQILTRLEQNAGSWNRVVGTAGINDTLNWPDVLGQIVKANIAGKIKTEAQCQTFVSQWSLLTNQSVGKSITSNTRFITGKISETDPLAQSSWASYYNPAGTGTLILKVPKICKAPFANSMSILHESIKAGLSGSQFRWVDIDTVLGLKDNLLQELYPTDTIFANSGWPHPNRTGAIRVGERILKN